jgi:type IV pilus assembly protein PilM
MAKSSAVWGIELGQCALKALRSRPHEKDDNRIVVEAFDYIEYPKILSQPEANRDELIQEALAQFVSRNDLEGDRVAISVPGQSGLARFIKLPPVEAKKIPDIVKYEARQQIPFALEDVVWDYQPLAGGSVDDGYALETEVGLFAMKRDQVAKALRPFEAAGVEVDIIQLAPLAIYNFICFDRLGNLANYQRETPPPSKVIISLGTDTTDLVITDGFRVWQRSIPIGGNHFTKSLTKELKLTFAKAEHLKRNAMKAENPKAVFQAMRPVFSDLVAEIQRSIGFFTSNNRNAKLGQVIALGNPMQLPGLQRYLSQNLDQEVYQLDAFEALVGGTATAVPQFKDNQLTFGVAYGLCVQALQKSQISTNLLPREIVTKRLVRAKKPWAVAAAALLLSGMAVNYWSHYSAWRGATVKSEYNPQMASALSASQEVANWAQNLSSTQTTLTGEFDQILQTGKNLVSNVEGRLLWLELLKAVDAALPKDRRPIAEREETVEDVTQREELHITSMECEYMEDVAPWFAGIAALYEEAKESSLRPEDQAEQPDAAAVDEAAAGAGTVAAEDGVAAAEEMAADPAAVVEPPVDQYADGTAEMTADGAAAAGGVSGPGWIIQLDGYHLHNTVRNNPNLQFQNNEGKQFVVKSFLRQLEEGTVQLPDGPGGELIDVPIKDLGISFPVVITKWRIDERQFFPDATEDEGGGQPRFSRAATVERGGLGAVAGTEEPRQWKLSRYDFVIQFCWQPKPRSDRQQKPTDEQAEGLPETVSVDGGVTPAG